MLAVLAAALLTRAAIETPLPPYFIAILAGLAALAARRPLHGVLVLCGLFPLASMISVLARVPWYSTQTALSLSLALLTGVLLNATKRGTLGVPPRVAIPLALYAALIVASAAATSIAAASSFGMWEGLRALTARDYLQVPSPQEPELFAFDALVGLGLFMAVLSVRGEGVERAVIRMLVAGLTAAAALNVLRFTQAVIASGEPAAAIARYAQSLRINVHYGDVNAAASTFALALLAAVGLASAGGHRLERAIFTACGIVLGGGLWLAGSRVAISSVVLAAAAPFVARLFGRRRPADWAGIGLLVVAAAAVAVWTVAKFPRTQANAPAAYALAIRMELITRAARMIREEPVFGVGVGRFPVESALFASADTFAGENSHNTLAQVAAELGLTGLVVFVWLLASAVAPVVRRESNAPPTLSWTAAGVLAYLLSGMAGHPLIVFDSAAPFWIALAILARGGEAAQRPARPRPLSPLGRRAVALAIILVACSVPLRSTQVSRGRGLYAHSTAAWQGDGTMRYRDVGTYDRINLPSDASTVVVPLRLTMAGPETGEVLVSVDGVPANGFTVTADGWTTARIWLTRARSYDDRRLELRLRRAPAGARLLVGRLSLER